MFGSGCLNHKTDDLFFYFFIFLFSFGFVLKFSGLCWSCLSLLWRKFGIKKGLLQNRIDPIYGIYTSGFFSFKNIRTNRLMRFTL